MTDKLTKKEQKEPIRTTIGRLKSRVLLNKDRRAYLLLEKIDDEIRENYEGEITI